MSLTRRQRLACLLRNLYLLELANACWFYHLFLQSLKPNAQFKKSHPEVPVPPFKLLYDIQGNCSLSGFFYNGQEQAQKISSIISAERPKQPLRILEWGCGPARILQHMKPADSSCWELWGADYNYKSISWCQQNWPDIHFLHNDLEPPIQAKNEFFDVIYCISVFTHLSEVRHYQWVSEINRLLKPGGIFISTFHGEAYRNNLTHEEQSFFDSGKLVIRDKIREGKKDFSAYHSDDFVRRLLASFETAKRLDVVAGFSQTVWIASKR